MNLFSLCFKVYHVLSLRATGQVVMATASLFLELAKGSHCDVAKLFETQNSRRNESRWWEQNHGEELCFFPVWGRKLLKQNIPTQGLQRFIWKNQPHVEVLDMVGWDLMISLYARKGEWRLQPPAKNRVLPVSLETKIPNHDVFVFHVFSFSLIEEVCILLQASFRFHFTLQMN